MLSTACSTHSSTGSISSSSSSLKNRRLEDITESPEEELDENGKKRKSTINTGLGSTKSAKRPRSPLAVEILPGNNESSTEAPDGGAKPVAQEPAPDTQPLIPPPATADASEENKENNATASSNTLQLPSAEPLEKRRKSTSSAHRPSLESFDYSYLYKPKVKVGPRPAQDALKRPHTSAGNGDRRPVASVPRGIKLTPKPLPQQSSSETKSRPSLDTSSLHEPERPTSSKSATTPFRPAFTYQFKELPPLPPTPVTPNTFPPLAGSDTPSPFAFSSGLAPPTPTTPTLSPEKQRLMKALQMRRRTMQPQAPTPIEDRRRSVDAQDKRRGMVLPEPIEIKSTDDKIRTDVEKTVSSPAASQQSTDDDKDDGEATEEEHEVEPVVTIKIEEAVEETKQAKEGAVVEEDKASENLEAKKKDGEEEQAAEVDLSAVADEAKLDKEEVTPSPVAIVVEETEGRKIRGGVESDDSDAESEHVEIAVAEQRPLTPLVDTFTIAAAPTPASPVHSSPTSNPVKTITIPSSPESKTVPSKPSVLKRLDREKFVVGGEIPVVETATARSVSAPFGNGRLQTGNAPLVVKKVNVGGGSVSQRIRQFQAIASQSGADKPIAPPGKLSPPRSSPHRTTSLVNLSVQNAPSQERPRAASRSGERPPLPQIRKFSFSNSAPIQPPQLFPSTAPVSRPAFSSSTAEFKDSKRPNAPSLQVTTKIIREPSQESITSHPYSAPQDQRPQTAVNATANRRTSVDMSAFPMNANRRASVDFSSKFSASPAGSIPQSSSRSFFGMPTLPASPMKPAHVSPISPTLTKKQLKEEKKEEKRRSRSSTNEKRSPVMPLLRRMSSTLSRRKAEKEVPAAPEPTVDAYEYSEPVAAPAKKTYLLNGWVNVQLPDTMLWRRRCMKIDNSGWLFLALSDDEFAPQTRKYHIATEVRQAKVPDPDEQELPFSVVVVLEEGGELQCACQNAREQKEVLSVIRKCIA